MSERDSPQQGASSVVRTMMKVLAGATLCGLAVMVGIILLYTPETEAQRFVDTDSDFPRLKYADSLVSVNDRCIVAQRKLNKNIKPYYVNGQPIGFC